MCVGLTDPAGSSRNPRSAGSVAGIQREFVGRILFVFWVWIVFVGRIFVCFLGLDCD
jgi:hypothetical protein